MLGFYVWEFVLAYYLEKNELGGSVSYVVYYWFVLFVEWEYDIIWISGNGVFGVWWEEMCF